MIRALIPSILQPIRLEFPHKIDHISEISTINDHKSEIFYCMKAHSVRDQLKIDHIAEKSIYPKTL